MKYTRIPTNTFQNLQLNAGILLSSFTPSTGAVTEANILGATSGGMNFTATPSFIDLGEDVDNCPKNTKELKQIESYEIKISGNFVTASAAMAKRLAGAADVTGTTVQTVTPRNDLVTADFTDLWWVGDYSDKNGATNGGFIAIHMMNTLSTGGFQIQSTDKSKGQFAFEFTAHYSINTQTTVPYEIYIKAGTAESGAYNMTVTSAAGTTSGKTAITVGETKTSSESYVYQTGYSLIVPDQNTVLDGTAWTAWDGTAEITATDGMDIIVAVVDSTTKAAAHAGKTTVVAAE